MSKHNQYFSQPKQQIVARKQELTISSGPLPPPEELAKYEQIHPGTTDILLNNFQKQVDHRISIEKAVIDNKNKIALNGQIFAFVLSLVAFIFGFIMVLINKNEFGVATIISSIAGLAGIFIYGRYQERKERVEKAKLVPEQ